MATFVKGKKNVDRLKTRKKILENNLTARMYNWFNSPESLRALTATSAACLKRMIEEPTAVNGACDEEKFLDVWKKHGAKPGMEGVIKLHSNAWKFNAADCSDVFRLAGAWMEKGGFEGRGEIVKEAFRPGVTTSGGELGGLDKPFSVLGHRDNCPCHMCCKRRAWGDGSRKFVGKGFDSMDLDYVGANARSRNPVKKHTFFSLIRSFSLFKFFRPMLPKTVQKRKDQGISGRELKRVTGNDSTLKIDRLLGLQKMCGISGTTADVSLVLEVWGHEDVNGFMNLSNLYYLLPVGTIAGSAHHSLLEVALVLSLNDCLKEDYRIGFYDTLLPKSSEIKKINTFRAHTLYNLLKIYTWKMRQDRLHFICVYESGTTKVAGAFVFDEREIECLRRSTDLLVATKLLYDVGGIQAYPGLRDVIKLCKLASGRGEWLGNRILSEAVNAKII